MSNAACTVGDADTHGGSVLEGSSNTIIHGSPATYIGAAVSDDPVGSSGHHGKTIKGNCSKNTFVAGKNLAYDGSSVSCGASLIASGTNTFVG